MTPLELTLNQIMEVFGSSLRLHPLFADPAPKNSWWAVDFFPIEGGWSVRLRTTADNIPNGTTHADINIIGDVFYLLHIELKKEFRGKGHGTELYRLFEKIAKELGCRQIEQTPSGWTITGETRQSYLERRGWQTNGLIAWKDLI